MNSGVIECVGAKIQNNANDNWVNVVGVYRPPKHSPFDFIKNMENILNEFNLSAGNTIITGDFNICILNENKNCSKTLLDQLRSLYFRPLVSIPTRITSNSATLIDHVWCNMPLQSQTFVIKIGITDHFPVHTLIKNINCKENKIVDIKFRNYSSENIQVFKD